MWIKNASQIGKSYRFSNLQDYWRNWTSFRQGWSQALSIWGKLSEQMVTLQGYFEDSWKSYKRLIESWRVLNKRGEVLLILKQAFKVIKLSLENLEERGVVLLKSGLDIKSLSESQTVLPSSKVHSQPQTSLKKLQRILNESLKAQAS